MSSDQEYKDQREERLERVEKLEKALITIRDKWLPALLRDCREPDKTHLNVGSIQFEIARVVPLWQFPQAESVECIHGEMLHKHCSIRKEG